MTNRFISYIQESRQELKKVNWPSRQETIRLTVVVIGLSIGLAIFLGAIDFILRYALEIFLT
ncbi:MAG: preprotein translocase subunit SecE [Patescibacteria group bacterium]